MNSSDSAKQKLTPPLATNNDDSKNLLMQKANALAKKIKHTHLRQQLAEEVLPFTEVEGFTLDISRTKLNSKMLAVLTKILEACNFGKKRDAMFMGKKINSTENRAVLHTALRKFNNNNLPQPKKEVLANVEEIRERVLEFCDKVHNAEVTAYNGKAFTHIVSIGIGGSYLGTRMAYEALKSSHSKRKTLAQKKLIFLSNVDGNAAHDVLQEVPLETTLFAIASKTFTTEETMQNAKTVRSQVAGLLGEKSIKHHFIALSSNLSAVKEFGILPERTFQFWDFVGGRFSVWSAVGMPLALALGSDVFLQFLKGAEKMDEHFLTAPLEKNLPVLVSLTHYFWNTLLGYSSRVVVPYSERLNALPLFLQQLEMESNGKSTAHSGKRINVGSNFVWGETGTNAQHSFFQLLHQGHNIAGVDFIAFQQTTNATMNKTSNTHHTKLMAHLFAQMEGLSLGKIEETLATKQTKSTAENLISSHKCFDGDRPSLLLMHTTLSAEGLGKIISLYEHKVFCEGVLWDVNSFDQWGVELGKTIAKKIHLAFVNNKTEELHNCTARLVKKLLD